jgi:hypothetical protein
VVENDRSRILQTVLLAAAVVVLAAGMAWLWAKVTEADDNAKSEAASPATTPGDPEAEVKADVEDAYRGYSDMVMRLLSEPKPDDPELSQRATGDALTRLVAALNELVATGDAIRYGETRSQTILAIDVSGDQATVRACFVDESGRFDAATGEVVDPMRVATIVDTATLERRDGIWRVSFRKEPEASEEWDGATSCDQ